MCMKFVFILSQFCHLTITGLVLSVIMSVILMAVMADGKRKSGIINEITIYFIKLKCTFLSDR